MLLVKGNAKLGPDVWQWSMTAGRTCPGATEYCAVACYAKKGRYGFGSVKDALSARTDMVDSDLPAWSASMALELAHLEPGSVVRIHASGDFHAAAYIRAWADLADRFPGITFYAYTRSWRVPRLRQALEHLASRPNVSLWHSSDYTSERPEGREARLFATDTEAREAGYTVCPEQAGRKASCSDCGLCWKVNKPTFRLAFVEHSTSKADRLELATLRA